MTSQSLLPFQPRTLARRKDPETSHLAANAAESVRNEHSRRILAAMRGRPPLAAEQIADLVELSAVQVNRRLAELEAAGLIERTTARHRNRSGRMAAKWRVC